jgi:thioester reductase-like protein
MNGHTIFLTGVTGSLGKGLLKELLSTTPHRLVLLVRNTKETATARVRRILAENSLDHYLDRVAVVGGDITRPDFGLTRDEVAALTAEVDLFFHVAALTDLNSTADESFTINYDGTGNAVKLAWKFLREGRLQRFCYFSTAFVVGSGQDACALEDSLPEHPAHANHYEASKYAAETRIRAAIAKGLPVTIIRPSIVVGSSDTGAVSEFNVIYPFMRLFAQGFVTKLPSKPENSFNIVPIDFVIRAALAITCQSQAIGKAFHLVTPSPPSIQLLIDTARSEYPTIPDIEIVPMMTFDKRALSDRERVVFETIEPYLGYLNHRLTFDCRNTEDALAGTGIEFPVTDGEFLKKLLHYAVDVGYLLQ